EHAVGEDECPRRGDRYGRQLHEEEVGVSAQEAVHAGWIERRRCEDAAEDDAEEAADSVNTPDVERVVPAKLVLQRNRVVADDAGNQSDEAGSSRRDITRGGRDGGEAGDRARQKPDEARLPELHPVETEPRDRAEAGGDVG